MFQSKNLFMATTLVVALFLGNFSPAHADEPFVGEIRWFAGNFAPRGWAFCDGQLLAVSQNDALFSILGTTYGGDGRTTFALPDMRGRMPMHIGNGPGLTPRRLGVKTGNETNTLTINQLPAHKHSLHANGSSGRASDPTGNVSGSIRRGYSSADPNMAMNEQSVSNTGSSIPVANVPPFETLHCIIALVGIFPSRQ
jgi:microcystin-dependent protein